MSFCPVVLLFVTSFSLTFSAFMTDENPASVLLATVQILRIITVLSAWQLN